MTLASAIEYYGENEPRGGMLVLAGGPTGRSSRKEKHKSFEEIALEEHMELYLTQGLSRKEAMKKVASDRGVFGGIFITRNCCDGGLDLPEFLPGLLGQCWFLPGVCLVGLVFLPG